MQRHVIENKLFFDDTARLICFLDQAEQTAKSLAIGKLPKCKTSFGAVSDRIGYLELGTSNWQGFMHSSDNAEHRTC